MIWTGTESTNICILYSLFTLKLHVLFKSILKGGKDTRILHTAVKQIQTDTDVDITTVDNGNQSIKPWNYNDSKLMHIRVPDLRKTVEHE